LRLLLVAGAGGGGFVSVLLSEKNENCLLKEDFLAACIKALKASREHKIMTHLKRRIFIAPTPSKRVVTA